MAWRHWPPRNLPDVTARLAQMRRLKLDAPPETRGDLLALIDELLDQHLVLCPKHRET